MLSASRRLVCVGLILETIHFLVIFGVYNILLVVTDIFDCFLSMIVFLLHRLASKNLM